LTEKAISARIGDLKNFPKSCPVPEIENDFMMSWIYSHLKYGRVTTPVQMRRSRERFLAELKRQDQEKKALEANYAAKLR